MASFISLSSKVVHDLCVQYLDYHNDKLLEMQEPIIQKAMKPKWFGFVKGKTRKEATKHLEESADLFGKYHLLKLCGAIEYSTIDNLRKLCLLNMNGEVYVDDFAAKILHVDGKRVYFENNGKV